MVLGRSVVAMIDEGQSIVQGNGEGRYDDRWSTVDDRWSMVGMGKSIGKFFCLILSCLLFYFFWFWYFILFFVLLNMVVRCLTWWCLFFFFFLVLFFFFFNIVLTWKFVEASKASVLYIYIYIYIDNSLNTKQSPRIK